MINTAISIASNHFALVAVAGGMSSACLNSAIEDIFDVFINKTQTLEIKTILLKCLISSLTIGLLLGIIFYPESHVWLSG